MSLILRDSLKRNPRVGDSRDRAGVAGTGLDANSCHTSVIVLNTDFMIRTVDRVLHHRIGECDGVDGVVVSATNTTNRQAMATRACATSKGDVLKNG